MTMTITGAERAASTESMTDRRATSPLQRRY